VNVLCLFFPKLGALSPFAFFMNDTGPISPILPPPFSATREASSLCFFFSLLFAITLQGIPPSRCALDSPLLGLVLRRFEAPTSTPTVYSSPPGPGCMRTCLAIFYACLLYSRIMDVCCFWTLLIVFSHETWTHLASFWKDLVLSSTYSHPPPLHSLTFPNFVFFPSPNSFGT